MDSTPTPVDTPLLLTDPLVELCPTLSSVQALARLPESCFTGGRAERTARLTRAFLRACSNGDADLLTWMLHLRVQASHAATSAEGGLQQPQVQMQPEAEAMKELDVRAARDEDGSGPLVLAACSGQVDIVHMLVQAGADVNERDASGWTPLLWAVNTSNAPLVAFFLSHGADVETRSSRGTSCEDFIVAVAPEVSSSPALGVAGPSRLPAAGGASGVSSTTSDRQIIADMVYEHQQGVVRERQRNYRRSGHSRGQSGAFSPNGMTSASPPKRHSLLSPHRDTSPSRFPTASPLTSPSPSGSEFAGLGSGHARTSSLAGAGARRILGRNERVQLADAELRARELAEGRKRALLDTAVLLEVEYQALIGEAPVVETEASARAARRGQQRRMHDRHQQQPLKATHSGLASGCGAAEVGADPLSAEFDWDSVRDEQMLVVSVYDLPPILDELLTRAKPVRAPWTARAAPANALFLFARYACRFDDEETLEEIILGAVDRVEAAIYARPTDMTVLAFWLFNCILLLHYTQRCSTMRNAPAMEEYRPLLSDLINEIYVFVIRDAERRIDRVMDAAILDHDAIPGFEEVRFEGEWKFMRNLTESVKGLGSAAGSVSGSPAQAPRRPLSQIFRRDATPEPTSQPGTGAATPTHAASNNAASPLRGDRVNSPRPQGTPTANVPQAMREDSYNASAADLLARPSPRTVTSLLTSTLHVLQLYEINPAIIVQALSQIFFWVGCELFNRVLTRKRYLCRSRAMQIRLNVSALEDWARSNALPLSIVNAHLSPLSQLVSWLQCQSTLREFVDLIATMQGLRALNPLQLRRAVRDYRFEVNETHMSAECVQYLEQLQKDWERRQDELAVLAVQRARKLELQTRGRQVQGKSSTTTTMHHRSGTATQHGNTPDSRSPSPPSSTEALAPADADDSTVTFAPPASASSTRPLTTEEELSRKTQAAIDSLFEPGRGMADYVPPWTAAGGAAAAQGDAAVEPAKGGELLNSRDMLPFALPTRTEALIVSPGDAFGFGRGHFQGTGTPSLKSVRAASPFPSNNGFTGPSPGLDSRPGSPSLSISNGDDGLSNTGSDEAVSVVSGASSALTGLSAASRSSLFATGKGIAAGAYWQPVPLLPDGLLAHIDAITAKAAAERPALERRGSILTALASPLTPSFAQGALPFVHEEPTRMAAVPLASSKNRAQMYGYEDSEASDGEASDDDDGEEEGTPGPEEATHARLPSSLAPIAARRHNRSISGLSAAPSRLVLPGRKAMMEHTRESLEEEDEMGGMTPMEGNLKRPF